MGINSTLKTISMADRMSVPQLQQAVKDGTVPAYIAVPLIQERMKDKQEAAMAAAAAQQKAPPVAQQVMQQADQQEALASLPTGMPQQYAGGGIVAFAEGDLVDDDDADDEREYMSALGQAMALRDARINQTPSVEGGLRSLPNMAYQDVAGARLRAERAPQAQSMYDARGHKYDSLADKYSNEMGLPSNLARYALHRETGGLRNPDTAVSKAGAIGPGQLMPATAKMLGVDPHKPEENVYGTVKYLKQLYDKYDGNEQLALAAYNAGPGRVDKALKSGKGINSLPAETLGYIKMAEGGLAHFAGEDESLVQLPHGYSPNEYEMFEDPTSGETYPRKKYSGIAGYGETLKAKAQGLQAPGQQPVVFPGAAQAEVRRADNAMQKQQPAAFKPQTAPVPAAPAQDATTPPVTAEAPKTSPFDDFWADYKAQKSEIGKQKELDKWLAMLNAGLGIMGGKSQNPLENIGQGGMYGAQTYAQASKATAAEEAALMKAGILAKRYEGLEDIARGGQELTGQRAEAALAEKKREAAQGALDRMVKVHTAKVQAKYGKDITLMDDATRKRYEAEMDSIYNTPRYLELDQIASPATYSGAKYLGPVKG